MCEEVAGAQAGPSSAEKPPAACLQPWVDRSGSLPPAACLPAARSNFLCIVPTTAFVPCTSHRVPHSTGRLPTPCLAARQHPCMHPSSFHWCSVLPTQLPAETHVPPQGAFHIVPHMQAEGGMETAGPSWGTRTDSGLWLMAMAVVVLRWMLAALSAQRNILAQVAASMGRQ